MKITEAPFSVRPVSPTGHSKPQPGGEQPAWRPGQILRATVSSVQDGRVTLDMNGRQFVAHSRLGLQEGQQLLLHVAALSPQVELQTLGLNQEIPQNTILQILNAGWDLPALLRHIQARRDAAGSGFDPLCNALKAFIAAMKGPATETSGPALAALLNNLGVVRLTSEDAPGTLREALARSGAEDADGEEVPLRLLDNLRQGLETIGRLNHQLLQEGAMVLPLPLPFLKQGFLFIEDSGDKRKGEIGSPKKICLHLEMEKLGEMRIDMLWDEKELCIRFTCESAAASRLLSEADDELRQALQDTSLGEIVFAIGSPRPEGDLLKHLGEPSSGFVNTRI